MPMKDVVMIRHAQSTWNAESRFTGWANPPLTELGINEAHRAANALTEAGMQFDCVFTSVLKRARQTADIIVEDLGQTGVPIIEDWRLCERHYGALQGKNKIEMAKEVGEDQVWRWRRGYEDTPPALDENDERHPRFSPLFSTLPKDQLPSVENLAATRARAVASWDELIVPELSQGKRILLSSHGNTLRALIMHLSGMSPAEVEKFEIPTGTPIVYRFDEHNEPVSWQYLES